MQGRKEEGRKEEFSSLEVRRKLSALKNVIMMRFNAVNFDRPHRVECPNDSSVQKQWFMDYSVIMLF